MRVDIVYQVNAPSVQLVFSHTPDVVIQEVERFKSLLHCGRYNIGFRSRLPIQQRCSPSKPSRKARLDILSRYKYKRLVEALDICSGHIKAKQVIANKFVERLQQERRSSQRCSVNGFSLLMTYRLFYDLDNELCVFRPEIEFRIFQIIEKALNRLLQFFTRDFLPAPDTFRVFQNCRPIFTVNLLQEILTRRQARLF